MFSTVTNYIKDHKKVLMDLLIYFLASFVPMFLNIITMPIYSTYLSAEDFAVIGFYNSFSLLFGPLISFYLIHNYMRCYFQHDDKKREQLHSDTVQLLVYFSAILAVLCVFAIFIYQSFFNTTSEIGVFPYAPYAMFYLSCTGLLSLKIAKMKMEKRSLPYFTFNSINAVLTVAFSLLFVVLGGGCAGKLGGTFLGAAILFLYLLWDSRKYLLRHFDFKSYRNILVFCFPLMLAAMLGFFSNGYDKVFLERHISLEKLGHYSVGVSISHFLYVFSDAIGATFSSDIYESVAKGNKKRCMNFVLLKLALVGAVVIPFAIFAPWIVNLLTAWKYKEAIPFCLITSFSAFTACLYYSISQITIASNHNKIPLVNRIIGSVLTIGMFYVFINKWGAYGAACGLVLNYLIYSITNVLLLGSFQLYKRKTNANA